MRLARSLTTVAAAALLCAVGAAPASAEHAPTVESTVTVTSAALDRAGTAFVTLTATCTEEGSLINVFAEVRQDIGRFNTVRGFGGATAPCENGVATATFPVMTWEGRFGGGPVRVQAFADDCQFSEEDGMGECTLFGVTEQTLRFSRVR